MSLWNCPWNKHMTWKTRFLLALAPPKRVIELYGHQIKYSKGWRTYTFSIVPNFITKTWTLQCSIPDLRNSQCLHWQTLWMGIEMRCCSALNSTKEVPEQNWTLSSSVYPVTAIQEVVWLTILLTTDVVIFLLVFSCGVWWDSLGSF